MSVNYFQMSGEKTSLGRRSVLKAAGAASLVPFAGVAGADSGGLLGTVIDTALDTASSALQESIVVFESNADVDKLDALDLVEGFFGYEVLPIGYTKLTGTQIETVAGWDSVRRVEANRELELYNDDGRDVTGVSKVQSDLGYTGESVHAVVIDSGIDGDHPDLAGNIETNYQWAGNPLGEPTLWVTSGGLDTDEIGHGTHCAGTIGGDGSASDGQYKGMAPDITLTSYSTSAGISILKSTAAYDHMLANGDGESYQVVSNSYGAASGNDFDPDTALNVATFEAFDSGILPVFAAGNDGETQTGETQTNMMNDYAKAPHVLGVAATNDQKVVTGFSSRGRVTGFWDRQTALANTQAYYAGESVSGPLGIYRPGIGAPGNNITSTMSPADPLQTTDDPIYYGTISGTSMACPHIAGIASLVVDAYKQTQGSFPDPVDVLTTLEADAYEADAGYEPHNVGSGFVDADASVRRGANNDLAGFDDVSLVSDD